MQTFKLCTARDLSAQLEHLAHRLCDCCHQPDGICPVCYRMHSPATMSGCDACAPEDEASATYYPGQRTLI